MRKIIFIIAFLIFLPCGIGALEYGDIQQALMALQSKAHSRILDFGHDAGIMPWLVGEVNVGFDRPYMIAGGGFPIPLAENFIILPHAGLFLLSQIGVSNSIYKPFGDLYAYTPSLVSVGAFLGARLVGKWEGFDCSLDTGILSGFDAYSFISTGVEMSYGYLLSGPQALDSKYLLTQFYFYPAINWNGFFSLLGKLMPMPDFSGFQHLGGNLISRIPFLDGVPVIMSVGQDYFKTSFKEDWDLYIDGRLFEKWSERNYPLVKIRLGRMFTLLPGMTFDKGFLDWKNQYIQVSGILPGLLEDEIFNGPKWGILWGLSYHVSYGLGGAFGVVTPAPFRAGLYLAMNYPDDQNVSGSTYSLFYMTLFIRLIPEGND